MVDIRHQIKRQNLQTWSNQIIFEIFFIEVRLSLLVAGYLRTTYTLMFDFK